MSVPVLEIEGLRVRHDGLGGASSILHGISLRIDPGERVALVGESGSGKSVTARVVLGLLQRMRGITVEGKVMFEGMDLSAMDRKERQALLGTRMTKIFQDPVASLNPVYRIGDQFREVLSRAHPGISAADSDARAGPLLADVAIADHGRVLDSYPFQLSGGMNQRVMIAMALAHGPSLLIADEPGTALDVTVQTQTLGLMRRLVEDLGTAVLFISHSLGVVREFADRVYVIHRGRIVEEGPTPALFENPGHPYTRDLLAAVPRITGEGLPELSAAPGAYDAPRVVHGPAAGEPE